MAIVRPELASEPYIQRIMAHHTTAREAGTVFERAKPKLAAYTHLVFLASGNVPPASNDDLTAEMSRLHNDANVLCLSADLLGDRLVNRMVEIWLKTDFEGGRHARRIEKIAAYEAQGGITAKAPSDEKEG